MHPTQKAARLIRNVVLEAISKDGFWLKIHAQARRGRHGGDEFQPAGILWYVEDLKRGTNTEIGPKDFFEIAFNKIEWSIHEDSKSNSNYIWCIRFK